VQHKYSSAHRIAQENVAQIHSAPVCRGIVGLHSTVLRYSTS